jgi:SAM-dependent methyltransferase
MKFPLPDSEKDYLRNFRSIFHNEEEAEDYLYNSWNRLQTVLEWLYRIEKEGAGRILELGSNPYFLTLLIRKHFHFELELANFFGNPAENGRHSQSVEGAGEKHDFPFQHFNLEVDAFPYEDASLDCVIFCEILEHLLLNPDHAVAEIRRVLRPGGWMIISTPNVTRLANAVRLLRGKNINDGYSPYGIYGRHNREYTMQEVVDLALRHSLRVVEKRLKNIYPHPFKSRALQALRPNTWYEHIFVLARKQ